MDSIFKVLLATLFCSAGIFFLVPLLVVSSPDSVNKSVIASDRMTHPPIQQVVENGAYQLEISTTDDWQTPAAIARLTQDGGLLWQKDLPQHYGPRFFLVSSSGQVVLFDEYINVESDYAIALIAPSGNTTGQYSFDDIHQTLRQTADPNITRADLTRQATSGWWISAPPTLSKADNTAQVETGGTTLQLNLDTGELMPFLNP